jgi:signal recognition particle GTPase
MTKEERENPDVLEDKKTGNSRVARIAAGAGVNRTDVKSLLKQYSLLREMISGGMGDIDPSKGMSQKQMQKLMKKFGKVKKVRF